MADMGAVQFALIPLRHRMMRRVAVLLLVALVLVQTIGVLHRVVHSHNLVTAQSESSYGLLSHLWGEHKSLADCQIFDQAAPDLLQPSYLITLTLPTPQLWRWVILSERFALFTRFYGARGPPVYS